MEIKIGELQDRTEVKISKDSPNQHMALFGLSGSGKSTRINEIIENIALGGGTVVAFDVNGQDYKNLNIKANFISATTDGINLRFLDTTIIEEQGESYPNFVSYLVEMITGTIGLGVRQIGALREAIEFAIQHQSEYETEMEAISEGLVIQNSSVAQGVYNKLWPILMSGVFRKSTKKIESGKVNILSFYGINPSTQRELVEIVLASLWRQLRLGNLTARSVCIVIDEFQNLSLKKNSVLMEMLREARKYETNIIVATQSTAAFSKEVMAAVNQTAIQLYFRPNITDIKKIADIVEPQNGNHWIVILKNLQVGQSLAVGNLNVRGKKVHKPLVITSSFYSKYTTINKLVKDNKF